MKAEMMFDKFVGSWAMCGVFIGDEKRWMRIVKKKRRENWNQIRKMISSATMI